MKILSPENIQGLIQLEPKFQEIIDKYGLPDIWSRPEGFETLVKIILEQQVSLESAQSAFHQLEMKLGDIKPKGILELNQAQMKAIYISRQKASYLHALSKAVIDKSLVLNDLNQLTQKGVMDKLIQIKGIGPWTAQVYLIFALRFEDIYPFGDVALNNAVRKIFGIKEISQIYDLSQNWTPYRTTASFLLWHNYLCERGRKWQG